MIMKCHVVLVFYVWKKIIIKEGNHISFIVQTMSFSFNTSLCFVTMKRVTHDNKWSFILYKRGINISPEKTPPQPEFLIARLHLTI